MRDEILIEYCDRISDNIEKCEAFARTTESMKKGLSIMAAMKTMNEMKVLSDERQELILNLLKYIRENYSDIAD